MDDIAVNIRCDASELTAGMTAARDQLEQTTVSIQRQEASWGVMGTAALQAVADIVAPILNLVTAQKQLQTATAAQAAISALATPITLTFGAAVNFLLSPIVLTAGALALAAAAVSYFASSEDEATTSTVAMTQSVAAAATGLDEISRFAEAIEASAFGQALANNMGEVWSAVSDVRAAFADLEAEIEAPFIAAGFEAGNLVEMIIGLNSKLQLLSAGLRATADAVGRVTSLTQAAIRGAEVVGRMAFNGFDQEAAEKAILRREAEQAAEIEALRAGKARATAEELVTSLTESATRAVREQAEIAAIASITTIEGIDAQQEALTAKIAAQERAGELDAAARAHAKDLVDALAKQRAEIESGAAAEKARREAEREAAEAAEQARREAERAAQQAAEASWAAMVRAEDQITALQDQYDVLKGTASEAEIAMRNALRGGATEEQAQRIKELTAANEEMRKQEQESAKAGKTSGGRFEVAKTSKAAFQGSAEAAQLLLRGVVKDPIAQKQLIIQTQILAATKANKPQPLQAANFGP